MIQRFHPLNTNDSNSRMARIRYYYQNLSWHSSFRVIRDLFSQWHELEYQYTIPFCDISDFTFQKKVKNMMPQKPVGAQVLYPELSFTIMQIAFEIHKTLGPGFAENIYEAAFIIELRRQRIPFEKQKPIEVTYKGESLGIYRLDLLVDQKVVIELKAVAALNDLFKQQVLSYLKAGDYRLGILINFGSRRLEHVRVVH